ncbi:M10 family metallopeptidase C-terminal domain-containing protein [Mycoplana rhizolycopersici]|uniref:Peptidase M10 serralysin C-terminal domain-containing protein n=1 Tax=Mycoplana rhizolycopersici TaxID=2746702 RepID=A0ABX2Q9J9_9HYPH|nr:hypothetical protein [Rhizobium rhizolycopersici]NVP54400.1 hypothetical protein [Rhizobium rhizolycopersici]
MAKITLGSMGKSKGFNFGNFYDLDILDYDNTTTPNSKGFKMFADGKNYTELKGTGLKYIFEDGEIFGLKSGTVTGLKHVEGGKMLLSITDLKMSAKTFSSTFEDDGPDALELILSGNDTITGTKFADAITGGGGKDTLNGGGGADKLYGGSGDDKLYGGAGRDELLGGAGKDTFIFKKASDSTVKASGRDTILDFSKKQGDRIDVSDIDAKTKASGDQDFAFIGTKDFSKKSGELRYEKKKADTYVYGDTNGDGKADFAIHIDSALKLDKGDFLL